MKVDKSESPSGYYFTGSFVVQADGLTEGTSVALFISKPLIFNGNLAAWRLFLYKYQGHLQLALILGLDTVKNNPSAGYSMTPIRISRVYDVAITYDTGRRFYLWSVNGKEIAAGDMPCDYPYIASKIIGSSASSAGRNTTYLVDNARWYELPR